MVTSETTKNATIIATFCVAQIATATTESADTYLPAHARKNRHRHFALP